MKEEISDSPLLQDLSPILQQGKNPANYAWECSLYSGNEKIEVYRIDRMKISMNVMKDIASVTVVKATIGYGTYAYDVYPNRNDLTMEIRKTPVNEETQTTSLEDSSQWSEIYVAVLAEVIDPKMLNKSRVDYDKDTMNSQELMSVRFNLVKKEVLLLRKVQLSTVIRNNTVEDGIKAIVGSVFSSLPLLESQRPKGVEMIPADNNEVRKCLLIPNGVDILDLARYIQKRGGGIYSSGIGSYLHDSHLYIFPLYNTKQFQTQGDRLIIYNLPEKMMPGLDVTFKESPGFKTIVTTGDTQMLDSAHYEQVSHGNGIRYTLASNLLDEYSKTENNQTVVSRRESINEVVGYDRGEDVNYAPLSKTPVNSNPYAEYSEMAKKNGQFVKVLWENSNHLFITPGQVVQFNYHAKGELQRKYGRILIADHDIVPNSAGAIERNFKTNTTLFLFLGNEGE